MSEGIAFQALTYRAPRRSATRFWLHSAIMERITSRRKREAEGRMRERGSILGSIFAIGQYAVIVAQRKTAERMD